VTKNISNRNKVIYHPRLSSHSYDEDIWLTWKRHRLVDADIPIELRNRQERDCWMQTRAGTLPAQELVAPKGVPVRPRSAYLTQRQRETMFTASASQIAAVVSQTAATTSRVTMARP